MKPLGKSDHLDAAQLARLLGAYDLREHEGRRRFAVVLALAKLGVRKSELCDLNREDIVLFNQQLVVRVWRGKTATRPGRPASRRVDRLLIDREMLDALQAYWSGIAETRSCACHADPERTGTPVFFTAGQTWRDAGPTRLTARSVDLIVANGATVAGLTPQLRITPHSLRATAATMMLRSGVNVATVARVLGHADINSTMPYLRATEQDVFAAQAVIQPGRTKPR